MQTHTLIARPWRSVPAAKPAYSQLSVLRTEGRLSIFSPRLAISTTFAISCILVIEALFLLGFSSPKVAQNGFTWTAPAVLASLALSAVAGMLVRALAVRLLVRHAFEVDATDWTVQLNKSRFMGLWTERERMSGRTSQLLGAKVRAHCALVLLAGWQLPLFRTRVADAD